MVMQDLLSMITDSSAPHEYPQTSTPTQDKQNTLSNNGYSRPNTAKLNSALGGRASTFHSGVSNWSQELNPIRMRDFHDEDEFGCVEPWESEEGRLSRSLKSWMPDYRIKSLPPQPNPPRQPIFSARLGDQMRIKRSDSSESIATQLSLFSCSSNGTKLSVSPKRRRRRRRKFEVEDQDNTGGKSIWVELASKRHGALDKMMRVHAMYAQMETETEIFQKLPEEEKHMVTEAGTQRGVALGPGRERSDSVSNVHKKLPEKKKMQRMQSAGGKHQGPMINFMEMRRQIVNQRLAALQQHHSKTRHSSRRSMGTRSLSRHSLTSVGSNDPFGNNTPRNMSPMEAEEDVDDGPVSVWKGDSQILAIDLKRELTAKVKSRIDSTTSALERATGYGDDNMPQSFVGPLEEYPFLTEEDYSHVAKIPQKIRISPHLSDVIRTDIHVRMGRPRYHEIRIKDLEMWNKGSSLDRAHRNLKVFNWLHSIRESDFDMRLPESVDDAPPGQDITTRDEVVVSVDEPKIKPLFERLKKELYIV